MFTQRAGLLTLALWLILATPILSQTNLAPLKLALGFGRQAGTIDGYTTGRYSLSNIAKFDRDQNACLGFAASTPDRTIILQQKFQRLNFQIDSRGNDSTLLIQTPDGQILCGDDSGRKKDARIQAIDLPSGEYKIWVGSMEAGKRISYKLLISE